MRPTSPSPRARTAGLAFALAAACFVAAAMPMPAVAVELKLLSAGAVEPGMRSALAAFARSSGHAVAIVFQAAPELRAALRGAPVADVVVAPQAVLDELPAAAAVPAAERAPIGRVGVGVAVRAGAAVPDVSSAEALKAALAGADAVVYNRASTGAWVETMFGRLGVADTVAPKTVRVADGAAVMRRLQEGTAAREIGFGAMTEIALFREQGIRLVGPLPAALQNETAYVALPWPGAAPADAARAEAVAALMRYLQGTEARAAFGAAGIKAPA